MEQNVEMNQDLGKYIEYRIGIELGGSFESCVRRDYDRNYIAFFGLGTAAAGWIRHWCTRNNVPVPSEEEREEIACRLLGWQ